MAKMILGDPNVISLAPKGCDKWGQWQFPHLSAMADGGITVEYSVGQDSAGGAAYRSAVSYDGGNTWRDVAKLPSPNGVVLANGDMLRAMTVQNLPAEQLALPKPRKGMLLDVVFYDFYDGEGFPECLRGRYIQRWKKGGEAWETERKRVESPDELFIVTWDDLAHHPFGSEGRFYCRQRVDRLAVAPNGDVWMASYYHSDENEYPYYGTVFFVSEDNGETFRYRSHVTYNDSFDPPAEHQVPGYRVAEGFCEPALAFLSDGSVLCLLRTGSYNPSFIMRSGDGGFHWSRPEIFDDFGVLPDMVTMADGTILAVYGRPGVRLRTCSDPSGMAWDAPVDVFKGRESSCSNCTLLKIAPQKALLAYSDFHYPDGTGGYTKAVLTREVTVEA